MIRARPIALVLLVVGAGLALLGVAYGVEGLTTWDGEACPAVFGDDRLIKILSGKDPECDPIREAQSTRVYALLWIGGVILLGAAAAWGTRFVRPARVRVEA